MARKKKTSEDLFHVEKKSAGQVIAPNQEIDTGSFEDKMTLKIELTSSKYEAVVAKLREICADDLGKALTEALHV